MNIMSYKFALIKFIIDEFEQFLMIESFENTITPHQYEPKNNIYIYEFTCPWQSWVQPSWHQARVRSIIRSLWELYPSCTPYLPKPWISWGCLKNDANMNIPLTRPSVTNPPAFSILDFSIGLSGLWSTLISYGWSLRHRTVRESPAFAVYNVFL